MGKTPIFAAVSFKGRGLWLGQRQAMFRVETTVKGSSRIVLTKIKLHD